MAAFLEPCRSVFFRWQGTLDDLLPKSHLARFIWEVLQSADFSSMEARYKSVHGGSGRPPYHPRILAALWIYGMSQGIEAASGIVAACKERDDFRWIAGGLQPCDQTLLNLLKMGKPLVSVWAEVLLAMQSAGLIDFSAVFEDGTKLRANASRRSFHSAAEIHGIIENLVESIACKEQEQSDSTKPERTCALDRQLRALRQRLCRAEQAIAQLCERAGRRGDSADGPDRSSSEASPSPSGGEQNPIKRGFGHDSFRHVEELDVMVCPADQQLLLIGTYPTDNRRGSYKLYGRRDCGDCQLKEQCTRARGRRLKVVMTAKKPEAEDTQTSPGENDGNASKTTTAGKKQSESTPQASLTDPEALLMLATSEKRWQPSFNADLVVTRDGIIVSQFLTNRPTDFNNFEPALSSVLSTLGTPDAWVGDGHYGTYANLLVADREGVTLYAPSTASNMLRLRPDAASDVDSREETPDARRGQRFDLLSFQHVPERDVMVCRAGEELQFIGTYANGNGAGSYRLYGRRDCTSCSLKNECTRARGRRLKVPSREQDSTMPGDSLTHKLRDLGKARDDRMEQDNDQMMQLRRQTVEPANAHLKQHGLGRFHVRGLRRCSAVLTLACIAHNLTKWHGKEVMKTMTAAA